LIHLESLSKEIIMTKTAFSTLGLSDDLLEALEKKGFESATPIQAETIPTALTTTQDIIAQAQTGTGKTAAFGLPILETLDPNADAIQALVLTPTRELTLQVTKELTELKGKKNCTITSVYGGQSYEVQIRQLKKKNDIVVGTPGRLIDHLKGKKIDLSQVKTVVLDEADEMLNSGFIEEIETILSKVNPNRRTFLFSATMPKPIQRLAETYMNDYVTIKVKKETLATTLTEQLYFQVRESDKLEALCRVIDVEDDFYGLIFCRTKRDVDTISEKLINKGYDAEAMHGDLSQFQRERVLQKFRKKLCTILVVTDVASRGLDISGLSHVINYALPQDAESYVHRVGRTGRAGQHGTAITFITPSEDRKLKLIQKVAKTDIKKSTLPRIEQIIERRELKLKEKIEAALEEPIDGRYAALAKSILADVHPVDVLSRVLKLAFDSELSDNKYSHIKEPSRRDRGGRQSRSDGPSGKTRLFIAKGKLDNMNARKLVGFLEKESRVKANRIQNVEIMDKFSFVNVSEKDAHAIIDAFKQKGRKRSLVEIAK